MRFELHTQPTVPLEVEGITPDRLANMGRDQIDRQPVHHGNEQAVLADFFRTEGDPTDAPWHWEGDFRNVHWIGAHMQTGEIQINGPVGRHLGSQMKGGSITVHGDAGDWVGGEMMGGCIHVTGHAGHLVGAAYRGSAKGMTGGTIVVDGDGGNEIGHSMRRGLIAIGGQAGDLVGVNMLAGTILVIGPAGIRPGAGMRRGTIGLWCDAPPELLPTFRFACRFRPPFFPMLKRRLAQIGFRHAEALADDLMALYHGDFLEGGRGEILLKA